MESTARRGGKLREHILWAAREVFLEMGYERTSMDEVARRAETSKRSLYAHFESKEKLFLAFLELMRGLFLGRLGTPGDYSDNPADALVVFCGRYLEILLHGSIRICRVVMAESARFPEASALSFDVVFLAVQERLSTYLKAVYGLTAEASADGADRLLGQILYPRFPRALFGIDALPESFDYEALAPDFDLEPVRRAVAGLIESLAKG
jgi:AcrR family transcriptional regulator